MKWALVAVGLVGAMALTVVLVGGWLRWRKRAITEAGARIGLSALAPGVKLMVPLVPLIDRPRRRYHVILPGLIHGREGAFFDLFVGSGEQWNLQSAVLLRDPGVAMPRFQLQRSQWATMYQRTGGDTVDVPGCENEMSRLKLTSDDPCWARDVFSRASSRFLEKVREGRWTIEGRNDALVIYRWGMRVSAGRLESYVGQAAELGSETFSLCGSGAARRSRGNDAWRGSDEHRSL